ncbi:alanyl-tRNA editing protein [Lysinibacillus sp. 54212]|uniref:alanyl-tRNA editing protein n=1 Tax=Lysinibacillus sp. 54212 TaxID=3119829 RepID=UPI002FC9CAB5
MITNFLPSSNEGFKVTEKDCCDTIILKELKRLKDLLYYQDSMIKEFTATVIKTGTESERHFLVLSNTAFYPTGGGQPHDTGWINDVEVIDVEKVDEDIRHYINGNSSQITGEVHGRLDWTRRFDHMQQHAGQHILTAAFVELFGYETVSFHLGSGLVSIDLNVSDISEDELHMAQQRANEIVLENRTIETKWVTKDELAQYNLRKDVSVDEDIRLVIIPEYDYNGCGGTHPKSTGQVQAIKIMEVEKMKQNIRVHFVCGGRVLQELSMRKNVLTDVARQLSVPESQANVALSKLMHATKTTEKALGEARDALLVYEAKELVGSAEEIIPLCFENRTIQELQKLGRFITQEDPGRIALLVGDNEDKLQFIAARGGDVATSMKAITANVLPLINGKGGGNDALVQGGGEKIIPASALLEEMKKALL